MTDEETRQFLQKYNMKILRSDDGWFPFPLGKQKIILGILDRYYNEDWERLNIEAYNYAISLMDMEGEIKEFENLKQCCQYYEEVTDIRFKKLREEFKLKQAQEDFE